MLCRFKDSDDSPALEPTSLPLLAEVESRRSVVTGENSHAVVCSLTSANLSSTCD